MSIQDGALACWLWTGGVVDSPRSSDVYPRLEVAGKKYLAHRLAWDFSCGDPGALQVDHAETCVSKRCMNPNHLTAMPGWLTIAKAASYRTSCKRGRRPYSPANTMRSNGRRRCGECDNAANRAYSQRGTRLADQLTPRSPDRP